MLFEIANHLRLPMYTLKSEMPYTELRDWLEYMRRRPPGWEDDRRTSFTLNALGVKAKGEEIFPSLQSIYKESRMNESACIERAKKNKFVSQFLIPHMEKINGSNSESAGP